MKVPAWVVVLSMVVNGMLLAALNYDVICPPKSAAFAGVSILLAGLTVFLGLSKSPIKVETTTETLTVTSTKPADPLPLPPPPKAGE